MYVYIESEREGDRERGRENRERDLAPVSGRGNGGR